MNNEMILTLFGGVLLLVLIIIAFVIYLKTSKSKKNTEAVNEFLMGLKYVFSKKMIDIVDNFNVTNYESLADLETSIITEIYDAIWNYIVDEINKAAEDDILMKLVSKLITKEAVDEFANKLIKEFGIMDRINSVWLFKKMSAVSTTIEEEDKSLQDKFSSSDYVEDSSDIDLAPVENTEPDEEELAKLNPQTDEEPEYDPENDQSVEEVTEDEYFYDKNGRRRSKATGRFA